jgi:CRP/FNR family cyclic AMP-dependent transcriptional regulator
MKLPNIFAKNAVAVSYAAGAIIFETGQPRD